MNNEWTNWKTLYLPVCHEYQIHHDHRHCHRNYRWQQQKQPQRQQHPEHKVSYNTSMELRNRRTKPHRGGRSRRSWTAFQAHRHHLCGAPPSPSTFSATSMQSIVTGVVVAQEKALRGDTIDFVTKDDKSSVIIEKPQHEPYHEEQQAVPWQTTVAANLTELDDALLLEKHVSCKAAEQSLGALSSCMRTYRHLRPGCPSRGPRFPHRHGAPTNPIARPTSMWQKPTMAMNNTRKDLSSPPHL